MTPFPRLRALWPLVWKTTLEQQFSVFQDARALIEQQHDGELKIIAAEYEVKLADQAARHAKEITSLKSGHNVEISELKIQHYAELRAQDERLQAQAEKHRQVLDECDVIHRDVYLQEISDLLAKQREEIEVRDRKISQIRERNERLQDALALKVMREAT